MAATDVIVWLLQGDPGVRWQVRRDLLDEPEETWRAERLRVAHEGLGAALLAARDDDGTWARAAFWPAGFTEADRRVEGQAWTATSFVLTELCDLGLDAASPVAAELVDAAAGLRWEHAGQPFWEGEVEECVNGRLVTVAAQLGVDVAGVVARLLADQQPDGGWNCDRERGSRVSSFDSTVNVVEALLAHELATGDTGTRAAREAGEEYLLQRGLWRGLRTGEPVDEAYLQLRHPRRWRYDVLRALDHLRRAGTALGRRPDPRSAEAAAYVRGRCRPDGRWPVDHVLPGRATLSPEAVPGQPSRRLTLEALRVLRWYDAAS